MDNMKKPDESVLAASGKQPAKGRRRRSVIREQRNAIISLICVIVVLAVAIPLVNKYIINVNTFTDYDGEKYKIKEVGGVYALYDLDGNKMDVTTDGYYVTSKLSTLLEIDPDTGSYEVVAIVDTEEGESVGTNQHLLMFNHTSSDNTQSIEVHNQYGTFTFYRDADDNVQIKGYEGTPYSQTMFTSLAVSCGYTLTSMKIEDPIKDEKGEYSEYGLAKATRKDENGNDYEYSPAWYRMTDINGNSYTVQVGDAIPSGNGYYVRYTARDAVYIMNYSVDGSVISMYDTTQTAENVENILDLPIEEFVSPVVCYPMTLNTYFDVTNFMIVKGDELAKFEADPNYQTTPFVCFSFWDMDSRFGTFYHTRAYNLQFPENYLMDSNSADAALQSFYTMSFVGVTKLGVTEEDLKTYGLDNPAYAIYFEFQDIDHMIYISALTERGTYYMNSAIYDMIVEVPSESLLFLDYKLIDWVDSAYFDMNIAWAKEVTVETADETYTFTLDNSQSDSMSNPTYSQKAKENTTIASDKMTMTGKDSKGNTVAAFSSYTITDKKGFTWTITKDKITAVNSEGTTCTIDGAMGAYNELGDVCTVITGSIEGVDGTVVNQITANYVIITDANGKSTKYLRYGMSTFRKFYQSMLYASLEGDVHDGYFGLTDEQIAAYTADPDKGTQVKITIKTIYEGFPEYVFRYYAYSERHSMITVNGGTGEFYVLRSFTDKMVTDAGRVIAGESVDPISKY